MSNILRTATGYDPSPTSRDERGVYTYTWDKADISFVENTYDVCYQCRYRHVSELQRGGGHFYSYIDVEYHCLLYGILLTTFEVEPKSQDLYPTLKRPEQCTYHDLYVKPLITKTYKQVIGATSVTPNVRWV